MAVDEIVAGSQAPDPLDVPRRVVYHWNDVSVWNDIEAILVEVLDSHGRVQRLSCDDCVWTG